MARHESHHWWFVGRRAVIRGLLSRLRLGPRAEILEAGCGTGGNLYLLGGHGRVWAFEPDVVARGHAATKPGATILAGELPDRVPFEDGSFDLVAALDILEHVEDDAAALASLIRATKPGGHLLITVPAHQWLWGSHDRRLHHRRRYGRRQILRLCRDAGAEVVYITAFNTVLSPIAVVVRLGERISPREVPDQERVPVGWLNDLLGRLFALEEGVVRRAFLPFGLSYGLILRRPG